MKQKNIAKNFPIRFFKYDKTMNIRQLGLKLHKKTTKPPT